MKSDIFDVLFKHIYAINHELACHCVDPIAQIEVSDRTFKTLAESYKGKHKLAGGETTPGMEIGKIKVHTQFGFFTIREKNDEKGVDTTRQNP